MLTNVGQSLRKKNQIPKLLSRQTALYYVRRRSKPRSLVLNFPSICRVCSPASVIHLRNVMFPTSHTLAFFVRRVSAAWSSYLPARERVYVQFSFQERLTLSAISACLIVAEKLTTKHNILRSCQIAALSHTRCRLKVRLHIEV